MPRGFLLRRFSNIPTYSYRPRMNSEGEDASDSGSEKDFPVTAVASLLNSPDSGYGQSPISVPAYHRDFLPTTPDRTSILARYIKARGLVERCENNNNNVISFARSPKRGTPEKEKCKASHVAKGTPKPKAARKIQFEESEELTSPVSGTVIRPLGETDERRVSGDIDSSLNCVDVSPEAREELAKIENKIGDYLCMLCKEQYDDAFMLAQHKCSRIVYVEYRCPECDKVFNCPANLASHRRWHKLRADGHGKTPTAENPSKPASDGGDARKENAAVHVCEDCGKTFKRQAYLAKHRVKHEKPGNGESRRSEFIKATIAKIDGPSEKGLACAFCPTLFSSPEKLGDHLEKSHPAEARFIFVSLLSKGER